MVALLLGRFQFWHIGHQLCIEAIRKYQSGTIIIGLRPKGTRPDDFLTDNQRIEIIQIAVPDAIIVPMVDIPHYDIGFSCNPEVQAIYKQHGKQVVELPRYGYSATEGRRRLALDLDISDMIVPGTGELIRRFWKEYHGHSA